MDMSSLLGEMEDMGDLTTKTGLGNTKSTADMPTQASILKQREKEEMAMKVGEGGKAGNSGKAAAGGPKRMAKKRIQQSKFHGDAPLEHMTEFLELVTANKIEEALEVSNKILKYEPDNILILMYQESMKELVQQQKEAEEEKLKRHKAGDVSSSSEEEDSDSSDSDSEDDNEDEESSGEYKAGAGSATMDSRSESKDAGRSAADVGAKAGAGQRMSADAKHDGASADFKDGAK